MFSPINEEILFDNIFHLFACDIGEEGIKKKINGRMKKLSAVRGLEPRDKDKNCFAGGAQSHALLQCSGCKN